MAKAGGRVRGAQKIQPGQRTVVERSHETGQPELVRERPAAAAHKPRTVKGVAPKVIPGVVTDLDTYVKIEAKIAAAKLTECEARRASTRARWEFGMAILAEIPSNLTKLPSGRFEEICASINRGETTVRYRMVLAKRYPTEEALTDLLDRDLGWKELRSEMIVVKPKPRAPEPEPRDEGPAPIGNRAEREARAALEKANPLLTRVAAAILNTREAVALAGDDEDVAQAAGAALASLEFLGEIVVKGAPDDGEDLGKALEALLS